MAKERRLKEILASLTKPSEKPLKDFLEEQSKPNVAVHYYNRMQTFLKWATKTPLELVEEFEQKEARSQILKFQAWLLSEGKKANTVRSYINGLRAFYTSQAESVKGLKGKIVATETAIGEHTFSTEDLKAMWHVANLRNKAILAVGCSLGWHSEAVANMNRNFFESLVKRARSQKQDFIAFDWIRKKTQKPIFGILTPCAIDSLERYLEKTKDSPKEKLWNGISQDTLTDILRSLAKEANIQTIGKIRWALLRKWLMSQLDNAGLSGFQTKIVLGKGIPATDLTYLQSLKRNAFEKYKKAYPLHLSLVAFSNGKASYNELTDLVTKHIKAQKQLIEYMENKGLLKAVPKAIQEQLKNVFEFAKAMEKKNGKPKEEEPHEG